MANWTKNFTQIDNVNSGREIEVTDTPTPQMFNVGLNNTQYLYNLINAGVVSSVTVENNNVKIGVKNASGTITYTTISIGQLNGYTKGEVDSLISGLQSSLTTSINGVENRTTSLENRMTTFNGKGRYFHQVTLGIGAYSGSSLVYEDVGAIWLSFVSDRASYGDNYNDIVQMSYDASDDKDVQATGRIKWNTGVDKFDIVCAVKLYHRDIEAYCIQTGSDFSFSVRTTISGYTLGIAHCWDVRVTDTKPNI